MPSTPYLVYNEPISGQPYPTSVLSGKPGKTVFSNPPFHPNILNIGGSNSTINPTPYNGKNPNGGVLRRGFLVAGAGVIKNYTGNLQYKVNFLYNPSTIEESRTLDLTNNTLPAYARNPDDPGSYVSALNTSVYFSLLFDRTFELWDSSYTGTLSGTYGVRADVEAFYNLLGINQPSTTTLALPLEGVNSPPVNNNQSITVQGYMQYVPTMLYFGDSVQGTLSYFGYITEFDVTYTHFTTEMVPMRCGIDVTFMGLANSTGTTTISTYSNQ